ncbi:MAG TPA: hypothetical protein VJ717_03460 [Gemmatimonadaceae bacterium]|nr:hypothetical protein [Gemmatimonadaceae bacterium]
MVVELDVFSGRPNPRWELDDRSCLELRQLQHRLTSTGDVPQEPPGLGYRGFVYADSGANTRAYRGFVTTSHEVLADPTFSIERFLLARLPEPYAALREKVESVLAR